MRIAPHNPADAARGHEPDRVNARAVVWSCAGLLATVLAALFGLSLLRARLATASRQPAIPTAWRTEERPPEEFDQPAQLRELRAWEKERLEGYGWQDDDRTIARIPIDRAMKILSEKDLPAAAPATPPEPPSVPPSGGSTP